LKVFLSAFICTIGGDLWERSRFIALGLTQHQKNVRCPLLALKWVAGKSVLNVRKCRFVYLYKIRSRPVAVVTSMAHFKIKHNAHDGISEENGE
jgi:hypothetical protein